MTKTLWLTYVFNAPACVCEVLPSLWSRTNSFEVVSPHRATQLDLFTSECSLTYSRTCHSLPPRRVEEMLSFFYGRHYCVSGSLDIALHGWSSVISLKKNSFSNKVPLLVAVCIFLYTGMRAVVISVWLQCLFLQQPLKCFFFWIFCTNQVSSQNRRMTARHWMRNFSRAAQIRVQYGPEHSASGHNATMLFMEQRGLFAHSVLLWLHLKWPGCWLCYHQTLRKWSTSSSLMTVLLIMSETNKYARENSSVSTLWIAPQNLGERLRLLNYCFFKSNTPDVPSPEEYIVRFLVSLLHAIKTPFFWWILSVHLLGLILRVLHFSSVTDVANCLRAIGSIVKSIKDKSPHLFLPYQDLYVEW